jgi:CRP/FNR family transcriptional regulator, cyclic AMP receptor protein
MAGSGIKEYLNKLREEMMFDMLTDEDIEKITPFFEVIVYPANTIIFKEGDLGDFIGFVLSGKLEVKKQTEFKGNQLIIALLSKGAMVGELSMFDEHKRSATVEAVEETTLMILRNESMESLIQQHPYTGIKILKALIKILALRLRKATERLTTIF